jgi:hypothetical protein
VIAKPDSAFIEIDSSWDPLFADDLVQEPGIKVDLNLLVKRSTEALLMSMIWKRGPVRPESVLTWMRSGRMSVKVASFGSIPRAPGLGRSVGW